VRVTTGAERKERIKFVTKGKPALF